MRDIILVNQAPHGIGPILRAAEMAQDLWHMLETEGRYCELVFPEPEKEAIKNILKNETFLDDRALEHVWMAPEYGEIVNSFDFSSDDYVDRLANIADNRGSLERKLVRKLDSGMEAYRLVRPEETMKVSHSDILCEVNHNPIVRSTLDREYPMFYTTIGLFSQMLAHAYEVNLRYRDISMQSLVDECIRQAWELERSQELLMVSEPSAMTYLGDPIGKNVMGIPPFIRPPSGSHEDIKEGVYINVSGIKAVQEQIIALARSFMDAGYTVYYSSSYKEGIEGGIEKAPAENGASIYSNLNIIAAVGRMGWSSVWEPMMNSAPFITYEYGANEDPEMHHNVKTLKQLGLGVVMGQGADPDLAMSEALGLRSGIKDYCNSLERKYGTINGIWYAAKEIYSRL